MVHRLSSSGMTGVTNTGLIAPIAYRCTDQSPPPSLTSDQTFRIAHIPFPSLPAAATHTRVPWRIQRLVGRG